MCEKLQNWIIFNQTVIFACIWTDIRIIETKECKVRHIAFIFALWNAQPILLDGRLFTDCLSTSTWVGLINSVYRWIQGA